MTHHPLPDAADPLRAAAQVMHAVRDQCVWTQRMTHRDLLPYLVEEGAELADAVEAGTPADIREELGDVLWQVLFHSEIASRAADEPFDIDDVARDLADKMVRRHPHVFGDAVATTPDQVRALWTAAKAAEKHDRTGVFDGVSDRMPTLALAQKLLGRAASLPALTANHGIPVEERGDAPYLGRNAIPGRESVPTPSGPARPHSEDELGDALLGLVAYARERGWDAERALRGRLRRLRGEVRATEAAASDVREAQARGSGAGTAAAPATPARQN